MGKTLVLYGDFIFDENSATVQNIHSVELLDIDLEEIEELADNKCGYTGLDYLIPERYDGKIIWKPQNPFDPAITAIDKMWEMKAIEENKPVPVDKKIKYHLYEIDIVEMQSESCPYGDPDQGVPENAINDFLNVSPLPREAHIWVGEHEFTVWAGERPGEYFANAWSIPGEGIQKEFCAYYEFKVGKVYKTINI